jgi:hypothetical protein
MNLITKTHQVGNKRFSISKREVYIEKGKNGHNTILPTSTHIGLYINSIKSFINYHFRNDNLEDIIFIKQFENEFGDIFKFTNFSSVLLNIPTGTLPSPMIHIYSTNDYGRNNGDVSHYLKIESSDFINERGIRFNNTLYDNLVLSDKGFKKIKDNFGDIWGMRWEFITKSEIEKKIEENKMFIAGLTKGLKEFENLLKEF